MVAGSVWILLLMPVAGISAEDPYWTKLAVFLAGVPLLMLGAVVYLRLLGSSGTSPPGMVEQNRNIALGASAGLVASLTALYPPLFARLAPWQFSPTVLQVQVPSLQIADISGRE